MGKKVVFTNATERRYQKAKTIDKGWGSGGRVD